MAYDLYFSSSDSQSAFNLVPFRKIKQVRMPVAPEKIRTKVNGNNKTVDLMNYGEYNILNSPGLTDIEFQLEFPSDDRPYANYQGGFKPPQYFLGVLEDLITSREPFNFILVRKRPDGTPLYDTNMTVSLEDYDITDDWEQGMDAMVSIKLKQYKKAATVTMKLEKAKSTLYLKEDKKSSQTSSSTGSSKSSSKVKSYTVKAGDTLWGICKKILGNGSECYAVAKYNNIKDADKIRAGQVIKFP